MDKSDQFLFVIQSNKGIIYKVVNAYCKNAEDRKDLVQEIIVQLWRAFEGYREEYKHSTWMYRIALNVAISFYRKEHRRKSIANPISDGIFQFADNDITEEKENELGLLQQLIAQLKDLDKALMVLYLEEKSQKEIAQIIGISETNVATKIYRIKNSLKEQFALIKKH